MYKADSMPISEPTYPTPIPIPPILPLFPGVDIVAKVEGISFASYLYN